MDEATRTAARRSAAAFFLAALCAAVVAFAAADHASATPAGVPFADTSPPATPAASYRGWGYVTTTNNTAPGVAAWRHTSSGWRAATLGVGESVWLHPYGSGWTWAHRNGSWYALRSSNTGVWRCNTTSRPWVRAGNQSARAHRYNSADSPVVGRLQNDQYVQILCGNSFPQARYSYRESGSHAFHGTGTIGGMRICTYTGYYGGAAPPQAQCMDVSEPMLLVRTVLGGRYQTVYIPAVTSFEDTVDMCNPACVPVAVA